MFICDKNYACCDYQYWDSEKDIVLEAKECGLLVEVSPVIHGEWLDGHCTACGCMELGIFAPKNYCPNCGAKMDKQPNKEGNDI